MPAPCTLCKNSITTAWNSQSSQIYPTPHSLSSFSYKAYFSSSLQKPKGGFLTQSKHLLAHLPFSLHTRSLPPLCVGWISVRLHLKGSFNELVAPSKAFNSSSTSVSPGERMKWTSGQQRAGQQMETDDFLLTEIKESTVKWKNGWRTEW